MEETFQTGEHVVHPLQGIGTVKEIRETDALGEKVQVYVIETTKGMEIMIPVQKARDVGIRKIVSGEGVERIFKILRSPAREEPFTASEGWHDRFVALKNRMREGTAETLAEIVRDLSKNSKVYELNVKEQEILKSARDLLVQEVMLAAGLSKTKAADRVDEALKANVRKKVVS